MRDGSSPAGQVAAWELEASEPVADYAMFRVRRDRVRSPKDGTLHDFHVVESPPGVTVIAITPEEELLLVEQYRHPCRERTLELPSGVVDEGETVPAAGARELREETGYGGDEPELLGTLTLNPSWITTRVHVLLVRGARREGTKDLDHTEDIRVQRLPLAELRGRVLDGTLHSAVVVGALTLLWSREESRGAGAG